MSALTKILIVLMLVFSIVSSVVLVLGVSKMEDKGGKVTSLSAQVTALQAQYAAAQKDVTTAQAQNAETERQLTALQTTSSKDSSEAAKALAKLDQDLTAAKISLADRDSQIASQTATIATLSASGEAQSKELALLRDQVPTLVKNNNELIRAKQEVDNQLNAANNSIKNYQEMIAKLQGGNGGATATGDMGMAPQVTALNGTSSGKINGTVKDVAMSAGRMRIEMPLGTRDGIQVGTKMFVYRANGYVGDATVETVTPEESVAVVISTKAGETVQKGDFVSTTGN